MTQIEAKIYQPTLNNHEMPKIVNKIRLQAITRKAIRDGKDFNSIATTLMSDRYFQEKEEIFGIKKAAQLTRDTIKQALDKENNDSSTKLAELV